MSDYQSFICKKLKIHDGDTPGKVFEVKLQYPKKVATMSKELVCPFCQQELESVLRLAGAGGLVEEAYLLCSKCDIRGEKELWQELTRTRKALDIAINVLNRVKDVKYEEYIDEKLEQINEIIKGGDNE